MEFFVQLFGIVQLKLVVIRNLDFVFRDVSLLLICFEIMSWKQMKEKKDGY